MEQPELFQSVNNNTNTTTCIDLPNGLKYYPDFLDGRSADAYFSSLQSEVNWSQPSIRIAGKTIPIPRLQSWQGESNQDGSAISYTYSGQRFESDKFHPAVRAIKEKIEHTAPHRFNSALCNLYRDGKDSVSWHADDEKELGEAPVIASFSLGQERVFQIKLKDNSEPKSDILLAHNSLLIMPAGFQSQFIHQIPKTSRVVSPRINLTFRFVYD